MSRRELANIQHGTRTTLQQREFRHSYSRRRTVPSQSQIENQSLPRCSSSCLPADLPDRILLIDAQVQTMANRISTLFDKAAQWAARQCGRAHTFAIAVIVVLVWAVTGPLFQFSNTWQLVINTGTTIIV
jgi:low affinity iron permease